MSTPVELVITRLRNVTCDPGQPISGYLRPVPRVPRAPRNQSADSRAPAILRS